MHHHSIIKTAVEEQQTCPPHATARTRNTRTIFKEAQAMLTAPMIRQGNETITANDSAKHQAVLAGNGKTEVLFSKPTDRIFDNSTLLFYL